MKLSKALFMPLIIGASLLPRISFAAIDILGGVRRAGEAIYGPGTEPLDPKVIIANLVQVLLGFVGIIFMVLIVWSGIRWMTSQGNEKIIEQSKATLRSATIGLILILMAYSIASFVALSLAQAV